MVPAVSDISMVVTDAEEKETKAVEIVQFILIELNTDLHCGLQ